jgi:hypothetical protein
VPAVTRAQRAVNVLRPLPRLFRARAKTHSGGEAHQWNWIDVIDTQLMSSPSTMVSQTSSFCRKPTAYNSGR